MATKKKRTVKKPDYIQYSKRTATFVSISWIILRLATLVVTIVRPETATSMTNWVAGVDSVMMINLGFYTGNSVAEKGILAFFDSKKNKEEDNSDIDIEGSENG